MITWLYAFIRWAGRAVRWLLSFIEAKPTRSESSTGVLDPAGIKETLDNLQVKPPLSQSDVPTVYVDVPEVVAQHDVSTAAVAEHATATVNAIADAVNAGLTRTEAEIRASSATELAKMMNKDYK